jgi:predicted kinase
MFSAAEDCAYIHCFTIYELSILKPLKKLLLRKRMRCRYVPQASVEELTAQMYPDWSGFHMPIP